MKIDQAVKENLIDRFEMMALAEQICALNRQGKHIASLKSVEFENGQFVFPLVVDVKKKEILFYLSMLLAAFLTITNKRLTSIFLNHYLACLNDPQSYKYLPKARRKPFIVACGGLSGSGKSRVAREIAPSLGQPLGAIVIRDDIIRKQIAGVSFDTELDESFYTPENEKKVYRLMRLQAKYVIAAGYPVIFDALFYNREERQNIERFATKMKVPFEGFWMNAPMKTRLERVQTRQHNPSDVKDEQALQKQLVQNTGVIWWRVINTDMPKDQTIAKVQKSLKKYM